MAEDLARKSADKVEWLGGSRVLLFHYRCIGLALLEYEKASAVFLHNAENCEQCFREAVSFISVEVLESYLDDLMDLSAPDDRLFLERVSRARDLRLLFGILYGSIATLLFVLFQDKMLLLLSFFVVFLAILFFPSCFRSKVIAARRLVLARVLSREINRRRGRDDGPLMPLRTAFHWRQVFPGGKTTSLPGAACRLWH